MIEPMWSLGDKLKEKARQLAKKKILKVEKLSSKKVGKKTIKSKKHEKTTKNKKER